MSDLELLRHALATVAYRGQKALQGAPESFAAYPEDSPRPAGKILAHMGDLFDWALTLVEGRQAWRNSPVLSWEEGSARFFESLQKLDTALASRTPPACSLAALFQGPVADALTHIGQIAMLRRMAGCPMKGENYYVAEIAVGRVGSAQAAPRREL
jgi:hypothetical protein